MWDMFGEPRKFSEAQIAKYKERFSHFTLHFIPPKKEWIQGDNEGVVEDPARWMALNSDYKPWGIDEHGRPDTTPLGNILSLLRSLGHNPSERELAEVLNPEGPFVRLRWVRVFPGAWRNPGGPSGPSSEQPLMDFDNFLKRMGHLKAPLDPEEEKEELRDAFKTLDADGDGFLSASELRNVLTSMGEPLTDKEVDEMLRSVDIDNDGKLNFAEFYEMTKQNDVDWD